MSDEKNTTTVDSPESDSANSGSVTSEVLVPLAELEKLRKQAGERDQYLDMLQRQRAEFENYQKRNSRDREQERKYLFGSYAMDILPVFDNLDRALDAARQAGETGPLAQGVAMVQTQFLELLKRQGITRIDALHKPFDPNLHQAVMQQPNEEVEPNTILQVLEQGFVHHDRVLRPSKVIVSRKP